MAKKERKNDEKNRNGRFSQKSESCFWKRRRVSAMLVSSRKKEDV